MSEPKMEICPISSGAMANRWVALAIVFVTRTSMGLQFQAVAAVAPLMIGELGLSYAQFGTLFGIYMLPGTAFALLGGVIGLRFGERRVVMAGLALMVAGGLLTAAAGSFAAAMTGRVVSGVGAVLVNILLAKLVSDWFAGKELSTAMAVMLTSWPVGLGIAAATLGGVAARLGWRSAVTATAIAAALGLLLMLLLYREAPRPAGAAAEPPRTLPTGRDLRLSISAGFAWGCFNASLVTIIAFGPGLLIARRATLGDAGFVVSLAIWVTIVSIPLGGLLSDRLARPNLVIVAGSLVAGGGHATDPGRRAGAPRILSARPRHRPSARAGDGTAATRVTARTADDGIRCLLHGLLPDDGAHSAGCRAHTRSERRSGRADRLCRRRDGDDGARAGGLPARRALTMATLKGLAFADVSLQQRGRPA